MKIDRLPAAPPTGKWKIYPVYKDSGVEWLGEIPEHWEVKRLKFFAPLHYGDSLPADFRHEGEVPVFGSNGAVGTHSQANTLSPALIIGRKGSFGKVNYSVQPCFAIDTTFYIDARGCKANLRWVYYVLLLLRLDAISEDSAIPGLSRELVHEQYLPYITLPEQQAIATFLDHETTRINSLIAKKERLIELLQEKRTTLISHAVTKGLNPEVKMKDSGIEWLGEIPEHWKVVRLKYLARLNYGDALPANARQEGKVPVYGSNGQVGFHVQSNTIKPVLIIGRKGSFGKVNYSVQPCFAIDTTFYVDARNSQVNLRWLYYVLLSLKLDTNSEDSAIPGLSREMVYRQYLPSILLTEQHSIASSLDHETTKIDALISRIREGIEKLKEYSTALIAAAVTGKIDVRGVAIEVQEIDVATGYQGL